MPRSPVATIAVTAAAVLLAGAGCGGSGDSPDWVQELEADRPRIVLGTTTSTVPTGPTVTTTLAAEDRDLFAIDPRGDDFDNVWRQLQAFELWLLAQPDPDLASEVYVEGTDLYDDAVELLTAAHDQGVSIRLEGSRVVAVEVTDRPDENTVQLRYVDTRQARTELDAVTGEELAREDYPPQTWVWEATLQADEDGRWRMADVDFVEFGPPPGG